MFRLSKNIFIRSNKLYYGYFFQWEYIESLENNSSVMFVIFIYVSYSFWASVYFTLILLQVGQQRPLSNALPDGY